MQGYKKHVKDGTENYDLHFDFSIWYSDFLVFLGIDPAGQTSGQTLGSELAEAGFDRQERYIRLACALEL